LSTRALDIKSGDEVIVPVFTYVATANAPLYCGAKPVFADIDEKTLNISPNEILEKITRKTKAIIIVHYAGHPCDMKDILEIAEDHNLYLIEDCAHSLGSQYEGRQTGTFGITGCFSFYPTKVITTLEGGMITTNNDNLTNRLRILRSQGVTQSALQREKTTSWHYDVKDLGYSYRLNEIQASLGMSQLNRINEGIQKRNNVANNYTKGLNVNGINTPYLAPNISHTYHLYVIKINNKICGVTRDQIYEKLAKKGIQTSVHFIPLNHLSLYKSIINSDDQIYPTAEKVYKQVLSLPIYPSLDKKKTNCIINNIKNILSNT